MTFLQIVLREADNAISGAELRNWANFQDLSIKLNGQQTALRIDATAKKRLASPTLRHLDPVDFADCLSLVETTKPDIVLLEGVGLLPVLVALRRAHPSLCIVTDMHNVESLLLRETDRARLPRGLRLLAPLLNWRRWQAADQADRRCAALSTALWTCSQDDTDAARRLGAKRVHIVENPVPEWCAGRSAAPTPEERRVLFIGHLGYGPNKRAVAELCQVILPALRRKIGAAELVIAGRRPGPKLSRMVASHGHRLIADPPEVAALYETASVTAIPLRQGGGTRIKVLEALAIGCPIVATAKAVEGLGLTAGTHYLQAETAQEFTEALARVLTDAGLHARLAHAGREVTARRFSTAARRENISRVIASLLADPR